MRRIFDKAAIIGVVFFTPMLVFSQPQAEEDGKPGNKEQDKQEQLDLLDDLYNKRPLKPLIIENKEEGLVATGVVGPFSNPDVGIGAVGVVGLFFNGDKEEPLFKYRPYNHRIIIGGYASTKGLIGVGVNYDAPYIFNSLFRFRSASDYFRVLDGNYFGSSSDTLNHLSLPGQGSFKRNTALKDAQAVVDSNGFSYNKYYSVFWERFLQSLNLERDFFGGIFRAQAGFIISKNIVRDYSFSKIEVNHKGSSTEATSFKTKLREDHEAGKVKGFNGGWDNSVSVGLAFDTRDFEPNPSSGVFIDATAQFYLKELESEFEYQRVTVVPRFYYKPFKAIPTVIATRFLFLAHFHDVPFYSMSYAVSTDRQLGGVFGGRLTGRGFRQKRFLAPVVTAATLELRTTFFKTTIFNQRLGFMIAPFIDIGTVYDNLEKANIETSRYKYGYGIGGRMSWNLSTIIIGDFGFSEEQWGFYFYVEHTY